MRKNGNQQRTLKNYSLYFIGIVAFLSTFLLGIIAFAHHPHTLMAYSPYAILILLINLIYLRIIKYSLQNYENNLKKEKDYSQKLLKSQKLFLRYAIHEMNTPLAVIMANIELYELELGKNSRVSNMEAATKNIYNIYSDLSYLTKKDKIDYPRSNIVLLEFIQSRVVFFDIVARQSQVILEIHNQCSRASIHINETQLQRIVDNNITNAIKYTTEHEIIHILVFEEEEYCVFEIASSSALIKDKKKIFEAYYREKSHEEGLGLGLNLVKKICDKEGIKIELHSKEDITVFKYYFLKAEY